MADKTLKDITTVLVYLKETKERKIGKSKLYEDVSTGVLRCNADGTFKQRDVDVYAASLKPLGGVAKGKDKDRAARAAIRKAEASARREEELAKALTRKREILEDRYLERSEVEAVFAGRAALLAQTYVSSIRSEAPLLVELVEGNPECSQKLVARLEELFRAQLHEYAKTDLFRITLTQEAHSEPIETGYHPDLFDEEDHDTDDD